MDQLLGHLLAGFGSACGLDGLALDDRGLCRLVFDERYAIDIAATDSTGELTGFLLSSTVGRVGEDASPALLRRFLSANLYVRSPNDGFVCLYPEREEAVLLCRHDCASMDANRFETALMDFLKQAQAWSDFIARGGDPPGASEEGGHDGLLSGGFVRA